MPSDWQDYCLLSVSVLRHVSSSSIWELKKRKLTIEAVGTVGLYLLALLDAVSYLVWPLNLVGP